MMDHRPEDTFHSECGELLEGMEGVLLSLEKNPTDQEQINELFRAVHTVKGTAGIFQFDELEAFTHVVEGMLVKIRSGEIMITSQFIELMLKCGDHIHQLVELAVNDEKANEATQNRGKLLIDEIGEFVDLNFESEPESEEIAEGETEAMADDGVTVASNHWHISMRFVPEVLQHGMDPKSFISYLSNIGKVNYLQTLWNELPDLDNIDPINCYIGFEITLISKHSKDDIADVFEFVQELSSIYILPPQALLSHYADLINHRKAHTPNIGELLLQSGSLTADELEIAESSEFAEIEEQDRIEEIFNAQREIQQESSQEVTQKKLNNSRHSTLRVNAHKLDSLINLVGELVISGASANLLAQKLGDEALTESLSQISRLVEDIRDQTLTLRMIPISDTFNRFKRVVRDYSEELQKNIRLDISGAETELDKTVVEKIGDPLMHLVRNAIDHGMEAPSLRKQLGKPEQGVLSLNAYHESGSIVIEVADDGKGLNSRNILAQAREKGIVSAEHNLTEAEIFNLIFAPGFSTAQEVTKISGRGVGMDVVKRNIEALRGTIELESSEGRGTRVRIRLPLTLAIIDGFLVGVGESRYVIPLDMVLECIELDDEERAEDRLQSYINLRDEVLPYLRLSELFTDEHAVGKRENIVVVEYANQKIGVVVDELLGEIQTVIKPLGKILQKLSGVSGATILGNGNVALILDVPNLIQRTVRSFGEMSKESQ